jgi:hypothetical protein
VAARSGSRAGGRRGGSQDRDRDERRALAASRRRHPAGKARDRVTPPPYVAGMDEHLRSALAPRTGAQQPLPFDDEADDPIPFALTARARRTVAPERLPPLEVVPDRGAADPGSSRPAPTADGPQPAAVRRQPAPATRPSQASRPGDDEDDGHLDDPTDTRPARARALRRAGVPVARIAAQLDVDDLAVRAWTGDVAAEPTTEPEPGGGTAPSRPRVPALARELEEDRTAFELARAAAREDALARLTDDPSFAAGVGLVAALAEVDTHAVTLVSPHPEVVGRVLGWLVSHAEVDPGRVRVVLRIGPDVAGDLARHRWAAGLGVPVDRVSHTRWRGAPAPDATDALVRLHDLALAATVAGWRDALLTPPTGDDPADVAF